MNNLGRTMVGYSPKDFRRKMLEIDREFKRQIDFYYQKLREIVSMNHLFEGQLILRNKENIIGDYAGIMKVAEAISDEYYGGLRAFQSLNHYDFHLKNIKMEVPQRLNGYPVKQANLVVRGTLRGYLYEVKQLHTDIERELHHREELISRLTTLTHDEIMDMVEKEQQQEQIQEQLLGEEQEAETVQESRIVPFPEQPELFMEWAEEKEAIIERKEVEADTEVEVEADPEPGSQEHSLYAITFENEETEFLKNEFLTEPVEEVIVEGLKLDEVESSSLFKPNPKAMESLQEFVAVDADTDEQDAFGKPYVKDDIDGKAVIASKQEAIACSQEEEPLVFEVPEELHMEEDIEEQPAHEEKGTEERMVDFWDSAVSQNLTAFPEVIFDEEPAAVAIEKKPFKETKAAVTLNPIEQQREALKAEKNRFMIDKFVGADLFGRDGRLLAAQGSKISEQLIDEADQEGKLVDLILNMRLS